MNVLYTTHCPKCRVLESKMKDKGLAYTIIDDMDEMVAKGFQAAPVLEVNGEAMEFSEAIKWVGAQ